LKLGGNFSGKEGMKKLLLSMKENVILREVELPNKAPFKGPGKSQSITGLFLLFFFFFLNSDFLRD
jgi:hypothetical protein